MGKKKNIKWSLVDGLWDKNNEELADVLNCSRERVRQKRLELGYESSPQGIRRPALQKDTIVYQLKKLATAKKTPTEIAEILGCDRSYVRFLLNDMGKPFKAEKRKSGKAKYHWDVLEAKDWKRLSDLMIQELLGVKKVSIVTQRRSPDRGNMPKADRNFVDSPAGYKYFKEVRSRIAPVLAERNGKKIVVKSKKRPNKRGGGKKVARQLA